MPYRRTLITLEVLSEEVIDPAMPLSVIVRETESGEYSGRILEFEGKDIDGPTAARYLIEQGSDPGFFGLSEDGAPLDEYGDSTGDGPTCARCGGEVDGSEEARNTYGGYERVCSQCANDPDEHREDDSMTGLHTVDPATHPARDPVRDHDAHTENED